MIYTDDRVELLKAFGKPDDPVSATELVESAQPKAGKGNRIKDRMAFMRGLGLSASPAEHSQGGKGRDSASRTEKDHAR